MFKFLTKKHRQKTDKFKKVVLVFPKGTIVKFGGIPCLLLQDTPYESEHYQNSITEQS